MSTNNTFTIEMKRFNGTGYTVSCPKTVIEQLHGWDAHHTKDEIHVTPEQREALKTFAVLNDKAFAPTKPTDCRVVKEYATYEEMVADSVNQANYTTCMVLDASGDITVDNGWACYSIHQQEHGFQYIKIADSAMLDMSVSFNAVKGITVSAQTFDSMVENSHIHANLATLDSLTDVTFRRNQVLNTVTTTVDSAVEGLTLKVGDMVFSKEDPK